MNDKLKFIDQAQFHELCGKSYATGQNSPARLLLQFHHFVSKIGAKDSRILSFSAV